MIHINSLEIHAAYHCNLSCRECMHLSPAEKEHYLSEQELKRDLQCLSGILEAEVIRLLGGEPLLHPHLEELALLIKETSICEKISISTNGICLPPKAACKELWPLISECEVTLYPQTVKIHEKIIQACHEISKRWEVRFYIYHCDFFRKLGTGCAITDDHLTRQLFDTCLAAHKWQCFNLFEGKFYMCPQAFALNRHLAPCDHEDNYVDVLKSQGLEGRIQAYIERTKPLSPCRYCYGSCGRLQSHSQISPQLMIAEAKNSDWHRDIDYEFLDGLMKNKGQQGSMKTVSRTTIIDHKKS